jgi:hypothetical protein
MFFLMTLISSVFIFYLFVELLKEMSECPCGLTQEQLLAAPSLSLGPGMVCIAFYADKSGNICNEPLSLHPHQQSGRYFFSEHFHFSFS